MYAALHCSGIRFIIYSRALGIVHPMKGLQLLRKPKSSVRIAQSFLSNNFKWILPSFTPNT